MTETSQTANQCCWSHRGGRLGETIQTASIKSHLDGWLASKGTRKAEATWKRYGMAVDAFLKTLGKRASKNLTSLTAKDVQRFLDSRTAADLAPTTVNMDVTIIRTALNAARRQGLIPTNPAEAVEFPKPQAWNAARSPRRN